MTPKDFRLLALSFPETSEKSHMDHPDFRVAGKLFATLGYPDEDWAWSNSHPSSRKCSSKLNQALSSMCRRMGTPRLHERAPERSQKAYAAPRSRSRLAPCRP